MGIGGAGALLGNPAGLGLTRESQVDFSFSQYSFENTAQFWNSANNTEGTTTRLSSAALAMPVPTTRGSFVIGMAFNRIRNFENELYGEYLNIKPMVSIRRVV